MSNIVNNLVELDPEYKLLVQKIYQFNAILEDLNSDKFYDDMNNAQLIAATTVGCSKHTSVLNKIKPRILLLEESGEILETHVLVNLYESIDLVIMIGDHKQLRPKINNYQLSYESNKGYNYNISLFEQLVNRVYFSQLIEQHRMRPEISLYVNQLFYNGTVINSSNTLQYDDIVGLKNNLIFFNHNYPEKNDTSYLINKRNTTKINEYSSLVCNNLVL